MVQYANKYTTELWTKHGELLADISRFARNRTLVLSRNQPDDYKFDMDLDRFEQYCRTLGLDASDVLKVDSTEVRVKRLKKYMSGGQLLYLEPELSPSANTVLCRSIGFLALFDKRRTGTTPAGTVLEVYTDEYGTDLSRTDLAWSLINQSQLLSNGDLGVTRGLTGGSTTKYDKSYGRTRIKDALQDMTKLETAPIDIEFTHDKVFNTYAYIGSDRPDIVFEYPGNILRIAAPVDGTDLTNEVIGVGAGANDGTQTVVVASDTASQATYQLRQDTVISQGTDDSDGGITDAAESELAAKREPISVPPFVVNGNIAPFVSDYGIGDRITVKVSGYSLLKVINGTYRIEKITIKIDDNNSEEVTLEVSKV